MASKYPVFDTSRLRILPLSQRRHEMSVSDVLKLGEAGVDFDHPDLALLADAVAEAVRSGSPVVMFLGAHVIKQGLSRYVIDLIRRGWVSVLAVNGACAIHDWELSRIGATTESVAEYIKAGQFGLWTETGELNDVVSAGSKADLGFGEAVGKAISQSSFEHKDVSIFAAAYECGVPATVHIGVGYDIIHEHPNFDAPAAGAASYRDFLILAKVLEALEGGVVLCYGSAVMAPEVFLKALAMARNVAAQAARGISHFTSGVFDLLALEGDLHTEAPKDSPAYYFRPYKTLLVRAVEDGGRSCYIRGDHRATLPALHRLLVDRLGD